MNMWLKTKTWLLLTGVAVSLSTSALPGATKEPGAKKGNQTMNAQIKKSAFGKLPDGTAVELYTLTNGKGMVAKITTYGALVTELHAP